MYYVPRTTYHAALEMLQKHERTGRPLGDDAFLDHMERHTGRVLRAQKQGRKAKVDK